MACSEYHSPQFSEDPAWLPAWLQPYDQTNKGFQGENLGNDTPFKACQFLQENLCKAGNPQLNSSGGAKYTSCKLYLSGDDYRQVGSASCSNAMNFHLHLSSSSISNVLPDQSNEIPDLHKHGINKCPSQKIASGNPVLNHGLAYQYTCGDLAPRHDSSPVNMPYECETDQHVISSHNTDQECLVKLDSGGLKSTGVDDIVELSIAASEALVISEMVSNSMHSESFSHAAILEIALRVKHARNECMLETPYAFSTDDPDDIDHIFDLDENSMSDAFEDVGITVQQLFQTSNGPFACKKSSKSTQGLGIKQQEILKSDSLYGHNTLAVNYGVEREVLTKMIKGDYICRTSSRIGSPLDCKLHSNSMQTEPRPQVQTNAPDNLPPYCSIPCLKDNSPAQEQKLHILDASPVNQMGPMEHHCIQKVGNISIPNAAKAKKNMKLFSWETSFLSESLDYLDEDVSQRKPSAELEIVSSSNTALQASSSVFCKEKEPNYEEPLSQDYSRSLSLADPLCSIVPCSISSGQSASYESKSAIDAVEKSKNPKTLMYSRCLDGDSTIQNNDSMLQKSSVESAKFFFSETKYLQPSVPHRKQLNSLRPYSLATNEERSNSPYKRLPLHDIYSSGEVIKYFNTNGTELPAKCLFTGKLNNEQILYHDKSGAPTLAFGVKENDDTRSTVQEDAQSPPILNFIIHPFEGCEVTTGSDGNESTKRSSASDLGKCRSDDLTKEASKNETINKYIPIPSNIHSFAAGKRPRKKRVRFQEATCNVGVPSTSTLQSKYLSHCSFSGTIKQLQNHGLLNKPESGRDQTVNYLTSNGAVRNNAMIFQGLEFLLTGLSNCKSKNLEELIRRHGGYVLPHIPSVSIYLRGKFIRSASRKLPIVLCPKKVQTTKFLYGCAVNTFVLNYHWLEDSIQSGSILPPGKYMIRCVPDSQGDKLIIGEPLCLNNDMPIFSKVGIMVHGKVKFCAKFMKIVKHGGGQVFKSLHRLVQNLKNGTNTLGIVLVKNESCVSRHLKHCAIEHGIPTMPASWITSSLFSGKLVPLKRDRCAAFRRIKMPSFPKPLLDEASQEI